MSERREMSAPEQWFYFDPDAVDIEEPVTMHLKITDEGLVIEVWAAEDTGAVKPGEDGPFASLALFDYELLNMAVTKGAK